MKSNKNIFLWASYDFANSVIMIVFFLYYSQFIVIERGVTDFAFNLTFAISTILLVFSVPVTGALLDKYWRRIDGLRYSTILTAVSYGLCVLFSLKGMNILSLAFFTLGMYFYQFSFTFYTPLLNDISSPRRRGLVSGIGIGANYLGQIFGLLIVLPFANGTISLFGSSPRVETLLPAIVVFIVLALPMMLFFDEPRRAKKRIDWRGTHAATVSLFSASGVLLFLLSYLMFNDAIITASSNFSIFLEQIWHVPDLVKTYILIGIMVTSAIGGFVSGQIADRFGHKRVLMMILCSWLVLLPVLGLLRNFTLFVIATAVMGFWFGATWAVSRSVMSYLSPKGKHNLAFAYFGLAERASTFVGPIVWGLIVTGLVSMGSVRYRIATLAITVFIVIGILFLVKVRSDRK